ncbi:MAG: hypothetical protein A2W82_06430 [Sulfurimonas sp. RIFCSPLOWO2_12_36_12]|uniref:WD40 repeat domain-containing protein n=1 Tax=Sulfurimonas sp. RIFCSPLOWO2_12_36_12 TaxID=1802253 RepID=UPI0008C77914|nr:WD40 repeat domain-containing protein [Sulfurimonas sp. RIFCSPLOWO2_12_36_12]OHE00626.1 MAG: hypothetical protein A2W82_06430 [Sulfurimonas sp. RIFCSPLOWO2_12_36_12]
MLKINECQIAKSDITELKVLNGSLVAYNTKFHGIKIFDFDECEVKKSIANVYLNSDVSVCSFSPNSELFAFVNTQTIYILDIQTKEIIHTIELNDEEIDIISFDPSSTYIIAGSKSGRVLQYKTNQSSLLSRLCSFPYNRENIDAQTIDSKNFVSSFAFYKNRFACSGYGCAVFIIDLQTQANKNVITHNKIRIDAMCFLDENTLICGNTDGVIDIVFLNEKNSYKSVKTPILRIKQILIMSNPNYIMVVGKSNIVTIVDIKNYKITHSKYIEFDTQINMVDIVKGDSLVVALINNKILHVELPGIAKLRSLIVHNSLEKAFELITKEPMLQGSNEHRVLEERFEKNYENATKALINQNIAQATQILDIYKNVKSKQLKIKELFIAFKNYLRFQALFLEKKYALAYGMCSKYEPLKQTVQYKKMEQVFKLAFANAQRHILQNNPAGARALLAEYNTVISKKPLIKLLLTQNREFVELLKAIQKRDFKTINKLISANELFKQIPNYIALNNQIEETLQEIEADIKRGDIESAKKLLLSVNEIPDVSQRVEQLHTKCKYVLSLQKAYEESDFKSCYEILDLHKYLRGVELGILLENHWSKLMQKCEEYALGGNIKDIKKTLGVLIGLYSRRNKIGDLLRVSFHVRINTLADKKDFKGAEAIIYSYIDIFGMDSEIAQIMKKFEKISAHKLAITEAQSQRPRRDSWRDFDIIMKSS